jgi:hypothetical protein
LPDSENEDDFISDEDMGEEGEFEQDSAGESQEDEMLFDEEGEEEGDEELVSDGGEDAPELVPI